MTPHERRLVRFLAARASYPHPTGRIVRRETHVSHVFLAGAFAYKLKKPVQFPFLDASTLARRKRFCQLELSLNRRLAPETYVGLTAVVETRGRGLRLGGPGRAVEWLVKMRRLPETRMLDRLISARRVSRRDVERVADRLMPFFRRAARSRAIDRYGSSPRVADLVLGNLRECQPFVGTLLTEGERQTLETAYRQFLVLREPLLARRVRERRVIDGHGDLRCENICLPRPDDLRRGRGLGRSGRPGGPRGPTEPVVIFDCVEFQPAFRCGDVVNDLSFLLMDLEFRGRRDLAAVVARRYRSAVRDPGCEAVLPFYKCHRSLVRAKVRALAWQQHPRTATGRRLSALARRHYRLALAYAGRFSRPRLIAVGGLIGTGKSTLARALARDFGAVWLRTDKIRLGEFARFRRPRQGFGGGLYAPHVSDMVYQRLIRRADELLREGRSVVCDGTFSKATGRTQLRDIARHHRASFHFFECVTPRATAMRRVARRAAGKRDLSEARPEHYARLRAGFEPVRRWSAGAWTRLSTGRSPRETRRRALAALRRAWR